MRLQIRNETWAFGLERHVSVACRCCWLRPVVAKRPSALFDDWIGLRELERWTRTVYCISNAFLHVCRRIKINPHGRRMSCFVGGRHGGRRLLRVTRMVAPMGYCYFEPSSLR
jgi:hypothetical protein